jgi:hypothetical protein
MSTEAGLPESVGNSANNREARTSTGMSATSGTVAKAGIHHRATIEPPPLPISFDFFSTFIDVSDSDPRSLMKV